MDFGEKLWIFDPFNSVYNTFIWVIPQLKENNVRTDIQCFGPNDQNP